MAKGLSHSSFVRPSWQCMDASRAVFGGDVTPLTEIVAPSIAMLPTDIAGQLKREFWKRHGERPDWPRKLDAQAWLASEVAEFEREKVGLAFDEWEIRSRAKRWAELCSRMMSLEAMQDFATSVGIEPPQVSKKEKKHGVTRVGAVKRLACPRWWRRQIRRAYTRRAESHLRAAGFVHRRREVYASDRAVKHRSERSRQTAEMLKEHVAVSSDGDQIELFDVVSKSQANPALRRKEMMTRMRGFEEVATAAGHEAMFITPTCPSAFHRMHANGTRNEKWQSFTPRQGQEWLRGMWARARAKLHRLSIFFYGFRIAEPHHDGTPHWHLLLFATPDNLVRVCDVLRILWLSEYAEEEGAKKHRITFERIRKEAGTATGYIAKYIAKNIDGFEVGDDYETDGKKAIESVDRVAAWASAHGIRQFQQIGGPSVTVWRECRRLRSGPVSDAAIEGARAAADSGEWSAFIAALGGVELGRRGSVGLWRELTGELTQYDELRQPAIAGVASTEARVRTRLKSWRIQRKERSACAGVVSATGGSNPRAQRSASSLGPVSITVRSTKTVPADELPATHARGSPWMH